MIQRIRALTTFDLESKVEYEVVTVGKMVLFKVSARAVFGVLSLMYLLSAYVSPHGNLSVL